MARKKTGKNKPICPRCGATVDYFSVEDRNGRKYVYAIHYYYEGKKR